jgi:hypothetical protein
MAATLLHPSAPIMRKRMTMESSIREIKDKSITDEIIMFNAFSK